MEGTLSIDSQPEKDTTLHIGLPLRSGPLLTAYVLEIYLPSAAKLLDIRQKYHISYRLQSRCTE